MSDLLSIFYMRDNHTFLRLPHSVDEALSALRSEFDDGCSYGTVFVRGKPPLDSTSGELYATVHAGGKEDWETFSTRIRELYQLKLLPLIEKLVAQKKRDEFRRRAMALYTPPFRYHCGYILDSENHTVADDVGSGELNLVSRVRGWGRIAYMTDAAALQDEVGEMMAEALTRYYEARTQ